MFGIWRKDVDLGATVPNLGRRAEEDSLKGNSRPGRSGCSCGFYPTISHFRRAYAS